MRPRGLIKSSPDDFVVDEIPAYEPSGSGEHLYVHFKKRGLNTDDAVRAIARALSVDLREVGVAGLKDKFAVTTQWISLLTRDADAEVRAKSLELEGIQILEARRHGNKLKTGHLRGNRFQIVVRDLPLTAEGDIRAAFERIAKEGVPNAFGTQRFGREGDNVEKARAWLTGKARAPGNPRLRRFHFSALQSAIFNAVLDARVADGTWNVPQAGDLLRKEDTGGLFLCTDVQIDRERASRGEVCPTGPILGDRMRQPEGDVRALEERISAPFIEGVDLHRARSLGEGTRRALRLAVDELGVDAVSIAEVMDPATKARGEQPYACRVSFVLPKGAYATTVLANVFDPLDVFEIQEANSSKDSSATTEPSDGSDSNDE
ncbi:tRNA pseudouridine 13 synthase [Labilithrix luteola]|uniref:tRNA pseudouridine synthase D n=1 Tax=Labilithrix luteola TaxID=1391654 RepID=A0A0K1QEH2_9BACT|nr:tRNA pseudouridine(13) synthase TruD [Labilithrix luteola]AKV03815.1 tRNA pseudouridine 13 synthase [Labilithrix luteola]